MSNQPIINCKATRLPRSYGPDGKPRPSPLRNDDTKHFLLQQGHPPPPPSPPPPAKVPRINLGGIGFGGRSAFMRFATPTTQV